MTFRISLSILATLLFICVLATLSSTANAHTSNLDEDAISSIRIMATGPLNIVYFEVRR